MWVDVIRKKGRFQIEHLVKLPFTGEVIVSEGQSVSTGDVVAKAMLPGDLHVIDVALGLGVPPEESSHYLSRSLGDYLEEDDILAQNEKKLLRLVRVPFKGKFIEFNHGKAIILTGEVISQVSSPMKGFVKEVIPEFGAVISTTGDLLQGIWGNGCIGEGKPYILEFDEGGLIDITAFESIEKGQVVVICGMLTKEILYQVLAYDISGMVCFSAEPQLVCVMMGLTIPVIVLQGFGDYQADPKSMEILKHQEGQIMCLNACLFDRRKGQFPEVVIPCDESASSGKMNQREKLAIGHQVQILSGKSMGKIGEIVDLPEEQIVFESGLVELCAEIQLLSGNKVQIPQTNLAILDT